MRHLRGSLLLAGLAISLVACGEDEPDGDGDGDSDVDSDSDSDGDGDGDADADADVDTVFDGSMCSPSLQDTACGDARSCTWSADCLVGGCECVGGLWSCSEEQTCSEGCPLPAETHCGEHCDLTEVSCLCRCGGGMGPNYSSCTCTGGAWACLTCGGD